MIRVNCLDCGRSQHAVTLSNHRRKCVAISTECSSLWRGPIGRSFTCCITFIHWLAPIGRIDSLELAKCFPRLRVRAPNGIEFRKVGITLAQPRKYSIATCAMEIQVEKYR